jgi:hypothetical protein
MILSVVLAIVVRHPVASSALTVLATLSGTVAAAAGTVQLRARTYRRLTARMRRGAAPVWWSFAVLAWLTILPAGIAASVTVLSEESFSSARSVGAVKFAAVLLAVLGLLLSAACSASSPPLLSASPKPRPYQAHWSQLTWTAAMLAATLCVMSVFLHHGQDSWVVELALTIGFGVIAALLAWHARALHNLRAQRGKLIESLVAAYAATSEPGHPSEATRTLLALRSVVLPGPFRSQSPAAPPAVAGWEVTEVVSIALHAHGYGDMPDSVTSRALLWEELGVPFRDLVDADGQHLRTASREFIARSIEWLGEFCTRILFAAQACERRPSHIGVPREHSPWRAQPVRGRP